MYVVLQYLINLPQSTTSEDEYLEHYPVYPAIYLNVWFIHFFEYERWRNREGEIWWNIKGKKKKQIFEKNKSSLIIKIFLLDYFIIHLKFQV